MKIVKISGREIYDDAGLPTLSCEVELEEGISVIASVPTGTTVGDYEALELRDGGKRLFGLGLSKAIERIEGVIAHVLVGKKPDLLQADLLMMQLDGTPNKSFLGANTTLAVSIAIARAQALIEGFEVFELIAQLVSNNSVAVPFPLVNIFSGGLHAQNPLFFQEIMIVPLGAESYRHALEIVAGVTHEVEEILRKRSISYGLSCEGAFAPMIAHEEGAFDILMKAIEIRGQNSCVLAIDAGASAFYDREGGFYQWHDELLTSADMISLYKNLVQNYPIYSIEDPLDQNDFTGWAQLTRELADKVQIVGDDLFATNVERISRGIEVDAATATIIKPNQVGTITEALDALALAKAHDLNTVVSHRSRETNDSFIVDFAVGSSAGQVKLGGFRGDRIAKYNRLLLIEDMLMEQMKK